MVKKSLTSALIALCAFFVLCAICFSGCSKNETLLLFNHSPITKDTVENNSREFAAGERIYYIFLTKKPLKSDIIQIKVMKMDEKGDYAPTKLIFANRYIMTKDEVNYFTNYVVFHDPGYYSMFVFSDELPHPLAIEPFRVK